ncbi:MAG: phosphatase PAP2 family protein [Pseudomonadota bacterium]
MKPAIFCCLLAALVALFPVVGLADDSSSGSTLPPPAGQGVEEPAPADQPRPDSLLGGLGYDFGYVMTSPVRLGALGWTVAAGVAGSAYYANERRDMLRNWWRNDVRCQTTDDIAKAVKPWGDDLTPAFLAGGFLAGGILTGSSRERETGIMVAETYAYTLAFTSLGQCMLAEDRPCEGGAQHYLKGIGHGISGHAAAAACLAGPLNRQYLQLSASDGGFSTAAKLCGKAVLYGAPVLVGLSRVNDDQHYLWNVIAGWAVGYTMGELIPNAREAHRKGRSWWVTPVTDGRAVGLALQIQN